jgi:antitoxin component YwqK of YwqJK toxin-antitoxin module
MKNIISYNNQGQPHGYWEVYYSSGQFWYKGNCINGKQDGFWMWNNYKELDFYL